MANTTNTYKKVTESLNSANMVENFKKGQKKVDIMGKFASLGVDVKMLNTQNEKTAA